MNIFETFAKIALDTTEYIKGLADAEGKSSSFADKLKSGLKTAADIGVKAIKGVTDGVMQLAKGMADGIMSVASYGDEIDKQSQKLGISAEAYQEWDAVLQHSGTSISVLKQGMEKLTGAMTDLSAATGEAVVDYGAIQDAELA